MDNVMRDSLGWPRQTQPVATQLVKVTRASTGLSLVISTARVDRIEQHQDGSRISFDDGSQMIVAETLDEIVAAARG
jgi:hypothetical protein